MLLVGFLFVFSAAFAKDTSLYKRAVYQFEPGKVLPYRILYPKNYDQSKKYPLIIFLHGSGERGNDNALQLVHGAKLFLKEENRKNFPAIVVFPQCPRESSWISIRRDTTKSPYALLFDYSTPPNWPLVAANELVKQLAKTEAVDTKRIYIGGLSMGGMGTFESVFRYPGMYAAALPICGGGDEALYDKRVNKTVFSIFHGASDPVVPVNLSTQMVAKLKALKVKVVYKEYPGVGHNSWDNAFAEPDFMSWMFQQKRKKVKL